MLHGLITLFNMENVRKLLIKTGQKFVLNYQSGYGYAFFKSKNNPSASRYELIFDEIDGYLVVCNGAKQAVFYEGKSAKYAVIMLFRAVFKSKKPVKFY
jgi:hypothetical protein